VNPRFGRRSWVKLWVNEWLDGTTRFEMSDAQRAFWIDLLALAGRSRYPGIICAGKTPDNKYIGYPINKYQSLMSEPLNVEETLTLFVRTGKIALEVTHEAPIRLLKLELLNWDKYQSEYNRQKKYRKKKDGYNQGYKDSYNQSNKTEVEVETDVEGEVDTEEAVVAAAFSAMNCEPFGSEKFKRIWTEEWQAPGNPSFADAMERAIQRCCSLKISVPGRFFAHKREIEKIEAEKAYKVTPL